MVINPITLRNEVLPVRAVSYTHLRAHETDSYLVCRLLLEKKKYAVFCLKKKNSFFFFFFLMIRRQPRSTHCISSAASDVYKRQTRDGSNYRPTHNSHSIANNSSSTLFGGPDITQHSAGVGNRGGAEEARKESSDHDSLHIFCGSSRERKDGGEKVRWQNCRFASIELRERCPEQGA